MTAPLELRHPRGDELASARQIAEDVMGQVYRHLLGGRSLVPPALEPWADSWIALLDGDPVGVGMSHEDLVSDLWLLPRARGHHIGSRLLDRLEGEVRERGYPRARLRVVADNESARAFYRARGWREAARFDHEKLGFQMLNMYKDLDCNEGDQR